MKTKWVRSVSMLAALILSFLAGNCSAASSFVAWGDDSDGQIDVPGDLTNAVSIVAAYRNSLALRADGTVEAWGYNFYGQTNVPLGLKDVVAIAAGYGHSIALRSDGTLSAWGRNYEGQIVVPVGLTSVKAIAGGYFHTLVLRSNTTVTAWGYNNYGQSAVPVALTNVVAIASGAYHNLVLKNDGMLVAWGDNRFGQTDIPSGLTNVVAISSQGNYNLVLKADGKVVAWGDNSSGQTHLPADLTNVLALAAGEIHALALQSNGMVIAWGATSSPPAGLTNVLSIAAGSLHDLALVSRPSPIGDSRPIITVQLTNESVTLGAMIELAASASFKVYTPGALPLAYQWQLDSTNLVGATNSFLDLLGVRLSDQGDYRLVVTNAFGSVTSAIATLTVAATPPNLPLAYDQRGIFNIDAFLDSSPTTDPIFVMLTNDFKIRRSGVLVTDFPCAGRVSQLPPTIYTDEIVLLQSIRTIYYMDRGRTNGLPWTSLSLYEWLKSKIAGVDIYPNVNSSYTYCCSTFEGRNYVEFPSLDEVSRNTFLRTWEGISGIVALLCHEARHVDGYPHSSCCGIPNGCDDSYDEANLSPYAIQWWLYRAWLYGYFNVGVGCLDADRTSNITTWFIGALNGYSGRFCAAKPPSLSLPRFPGGDCAPLISAIEFVSSTNMLVSIKGLTVGVSHRIEYASALSSNQWRTVDTFIPSSTMIQRSVRIPANALQYGFVRAIAQ